MTDTELLARLDERINSLKDHVSIKFEEQEKKTTLAFDFINNKLAKKEDLEYHVRNHNSGIKIFAIIFSVVLGAWNILKDTLLQNPFLKP